MFHLNEENDRVTLEFIKLNRPITLTPRMILNPGSVGQPRDRDPRAAYAIYDTGTRQWESRRVEYNVSEVQQRLRESGLPKNMP